MAHVERTATFDRGAEEVWGKIGDYGTIDSWHPAVTSCERKGDQRLITLGDGGQLHETLVSEGPLTYSYTVDEGPLPVADYTSTLAVADTADGCEVQWSADFAPDGVPEDEATELIGGIFDAGLSAV